MFLSVKEMTWVTFCMYNTCGKFKSGPQLISVLGECIRDDAEDGHISSGPGMFYFVSATFFGFTSTC